VGDFKLVNGGAADGEPPQVMEIKAEDVNAMRDFLVARFKGIFPACMFLSGYSGLTIGTFARQQGAKRNDCEEILALLHNGINEAFEQAFRGEGSGKPKGAN
jgi:hypothetical protein